MYALAVFLYWDGEQHLLHDVLDLLDRGDLAGERLLGEVSTRSISFCAASASNSVVASPAFWIAVVILSRVKGDNCSVALFD